VGPDTVLALGRDVAVVTLMVAGPILATALAVGLAVSLAQAVTQVQEMTLTFIPKLLALVAVLALLGHWMLATLVAFTVRLLGHLPAYTVRP
jgi:flagellar biosynthetic protein FliQ